MTPDPPRTGPGADGAEVAAPPTVRHGRHRGISPPVPPTIVRPGGRAAAAPAPAARDDTAGMVPPTIRRDGAPPTVARHGRPAGAAPPTVLRGTPPDPPTRVPGAAGQALFPAELEGEYEPLEICGSGSEADVWHARRVADGLEVAVKTYRPGVPVDLDLLRHLDDARFRRHVPELYGFGNVATPYGPVAWVAMEYVPATLAGLMAAEREPGGAVPPQRARELVAELAATLHFWQDPDGLARTPIDVKPDNFGVRRDHPARLVVIDFGGVVRQTVTQRMGDVAAAQAYMSPEGIIGERRQASPWWSLGVIAYELATGGTRFRRADGSLLPDQVLLRETALAEVDLSEVEDARWRLLLAGLLTRHPDDRWGWDQVHEWLGGGSPPVTRATAAAPPAHAPIMFQGTSYWRPADLAAQFLAQPEAAAMWLLDGQERLRSWLREDVADNQFDTHYLAAVSRARPASAPLAVLAFGAVYAPGATPVYQEHRVDAAGLSVLCAAGQARSSVLRELFEQDVLPLAARYRCAHPGCPDGDQCRVLARAVIEVPRIVRSVEQLAAGLPGAGPDRAAARSAGLSGPERDLALATATQLTLQAGERAGAARNPVRLGSLGLGAPAWWRQLAGQAAQADPALESGRATLTAVVVLQARALAERSQARQGLADRARGRLATARGGAGIAACTLAALVLLNWSAAVGAFAIAARDGQLMSASAQQAAAGDLLGSSAAASVFMALPLIAIIAVAAALPRIGRRLLVPGVLGVTALGFAAARMPPFPATPVPQVVDYWLVSAGGAWHQLAGIAALLICPAAALAALAGAGRLRRRQGNPRRPAAPLVRLPPGLRRPVTGLISLAVLEALLWASVVVRMTVTGPVQGDAAISAAGASGQSGLLLACTVIAALTAVLPEAAAYRVLVGAALAATAAGVWSGPLPALHAIWHPVAAQALASLAGVWGGATFWAAVGLAVPAALAGLAVVADQRAAWRR
jgi:hypothetical protein